MSDQENKAAETVAATEVAEVPETETKADETTEAPATADDTVKADSKEDEAKEQGSSKPKEMLKVRRDDGTKTRTDLTSLPETDDPKQIRAQVEFYFGNSNLRTDKFLNEKIDGAKNNPVPLSLLCTFSRMRRFKPYSAVVAALKESNQLIVDGPEGEETVQRKTPFDPNKANKADENSVYVKGFGEETSSTQFDLEEFFAQFGTFNAVRLRRSQDKNKNFKGSVFVEWADKETADKFLSLDPKPEWKGAHPLKIMSKLAYCEEKNQEIRDGKKEPFSNQGFRGGRGGRGRGRGRGGNRGDQNDWKKRRDDDQRNGFKDRNGRGRGRGRGRGGNRGRDRGDRNQGDRAAEEPAADKREIGRPKIHTSDEGAKIMKEEATNGKRSRDEDGASGEPPAKKVDTKAEA